MLDFVNAYEALLDAFTSRRYNVWLRDSYLRDTSETGMQSLEEYGRRVAEDERRIRRLLTELVQFPPHHNRHFGIVQTFYEAGSTYDSAVFVMTTFPEKNNGSQQHVRLTEIIEHVVTSLRDNGYHPRIASEKRPPYHQGLWDNVEAYLFCCRSGVAIVENKCQNEFNPNVAMEWGWLRAMNKKVLYLIEEDFKHIADTAGLLYGKFSWDNPQPGIVEAINRYFPKM